MKTKFFRYLLFPIALLIGLYGCSQPKNVTYQGLRSFRVHSIDLKQITVVIALEFYNPNHFGLSLKNGNLDAYFNNKYLGKASIDERTVLPARGNFTLPITITTPVANLFANTLEILSNKNQPIFVRLEGTIRAGKGNVFLPVPVHYEGKQQLNL